MHLAHGVRRPDLFDYAGIPDYRDLWDPE